MNTKSKFQWGEILLAKCICFGFVIMVASCSKDQAEPKKEEPKVEKLTYANFAGAFFQSKCSGCHGTGGAGSGKWVFSGYTSVKNNSAAIKAAISSGLMPQPANSLSASEKTRIIKWFDEGLLEK